MASSLSFRPPCSHPCNLRSGFPLICRPSSPFLAYRGLRLRRSCSVIPSEEGKLEASWIHVDGNSHDDFGGWSVRYSEMEEKKASPRILFVGVGASMTILLAALTYCSLSKKGFKFHLATTFQSFHEKLLPIGSKIDAGKGTKPTSPDINQSPESKVDMASDSSKPNENDLPEPGGSKHIIIPVAADPTQLQALSVLKKLKIIENDVSADELCTRREYARWFVKANSMLERSPKHKIVPEILTAGSIVSAFDDVSVDDPDFWYIQSLAEAGIVGSKLSGLNSCGLSDMGCSDSVQKFYFFPDSFVSRFYLVNWKALLEYSINSEIDEKMLRTKVGFMDLSTISDASLQFLMDLAAGDESIVRRVFGNTRRLQPHKPVTKAQVAVALTSGRLVEVIRTEVSRLEAENLSRLAEMEEIRSELIRRGEIQRLWEEKLHGEQERGLEVEKDLQAAFHDLEKEKVAQNESFAEYMKEKAALDCQQELLSSLREEVDGMYDRLERERANFVAERRDLQKMYADLRNRQDAIIEAKSILEAEKEALRILRSWVEEEALQIRGRAKVLEQAVERWQCSKKLELTRANSVDSNG